MLFSLLLCSYKQYINIPSHLVVCNMYEKLLEECGLTQNEALVYMALIRLEKAKSGEIVREARISGGKIYETLYKLIDKGLVKEVSENGTKRFIPNNPQTVITYVEETQKDLEEKKKELEGIIPSLANIERIDKVQESVALTKG